MALELAYDVVVCGTLHVLVSACGSGSGFIMGATGEPVAAVRLVPALDRLVSLLMLLVCPCALDVAAVVRAPTTLGGGRGGSRLMPPQLERSTGERNGPADASDPLEAVMQCVYGAALLAASMASLTDVTLPDAVSATMGRVGVPRLDTAPLAVVATLGTPGVTKYATRFFHELLRSLEGVMAARCQRPLLNSGCDTVVNSRL